jgi:uncharacterized protein (TIGR03083 family)
VTLSVEQYLAAITQHSQGLAEAARGNLAAPVEHCPGWTVGDLVWHVADVHWFWGTIAGELLAEPPSEERRPSRPSDEVLIDHFLAGADRLVSTLRAADQTATCWTWANQKDVAFVTRHQVQEAAVHHWDAAHAAQQTITYDFVADEVAADCVDEFLTFSVSTEDDPADAPPLDGSLWFCGCVTISDAVYQWLIEDGPTPGTIAASHQRAPAIMGAHCSPSDLLLWLYGRTPTNASHFPLESEPLVQRFRALCFTD